MFQSIDMTLLAVILSPLVFFLIYIVIIVFFKVSLKSLEFKILTLMVTGYVFLVSSTAIGVGYFSDNPNFVYTLLQSVTGVGLVFFTFYYVVRIIKRYSSLAKEVSSIATELAASSEEVSAASEEISSTVNNVLENGRKIKESSDYINKILQIITDISDQTNLLAINAKIEASRAGEHGRGFGAVADEVRKLSTETKEALSDSNKKVKEILSQIDHQFNSLLMVTSATEEQASSMEQISTTANQLDSLAITLSGKFKKRV